MANNTEAKQQTKQILFSLFDEGSVMEIGDLAASGESGVLAAWGTADGNPVFAFAQDSGTIGGAFGTAASEKIGKIYELAAQNGAPVVGIFDSNGVRMAEGGEVMSALGKFMNSANTLSGVVPQIAVVTGTCGGSMAMIAECADAVILCEDAQLFLTPDDIIKAAQPGYKPAKSSVTAAKNGTAALVTKDAASAVEAAKKLLSYLPSNNLDVPPVFDFTEPAEGIADSDSFYELYAEYGTTAKVGFATVGGQSVGLVSTAKDEKGYIRSCAAKKIARFVRLCDAYSIPVVTLVDTDGFAPDGDGEAKGAIMTAAALSQAYAEATCPKISVITGKAIGPVYIATCGKSANADAVFAYENAIISPVNPDAALIINEPQLLDNCKSEAERKAVYAAYAADKLGAKAAASAGLVDAIVTSATIRAQVLSALSMLSGKRVSRMPKKHATNLL
ncbi:MAG TPA: carboxyl transferase domain-containing protein [Oscillospiraceae bacterium]|nr:carboxyl transferase domain-containing protein [Oscillospiraceae bacterium]HPF56690.1 carboxyl transferase domain-containing protein [Clostridiales bacterium]HPK35335.1 carboxyl transferase domain-containing protein [Oscillospiraceae bacterium]HPR74649.1 carboxyl transferase domain-containing protein [Oscillospiraceae bacterium]